MSVKTESITRILRLQNKQPDEISFWFRPSTEAQAFHCPYCGTFQFYHKHRIIALIEDDLSQTLHSPPLSPQCRKCGAIFHCHVL